MNFFDQSKLRQVPRAEVKPNEVLCNYCTAKCCRYFSLSIDRPKTAKDFDYLRWYLLHEHATIFTEDDDWYLLVHTTCKHLQDDHRCGIYDTRPQICRDYTTKQCEYEDSYTFDRYFETPEQIEEYAAARFQTMKNFRSPKPGLPILR
ncbi:MAG: YkgJ family cysteine cluster protein [Planctomycetota bacterium]